MKKRVFLTLGILAGLIILAPIMFFLMLKANFKPAVSFWNKAFSYEKVLAVERQDNTKDAFNNSNVIYILFLGIDRTDNREKDSSFFRSDTISLFKFDLATRKANILCIPRDTYTYLPVEKKMDKINHAYAFGSMEGKAVESTIDAVHTFTGLPVDYYITLDMESIQNIVDDIGGVELDVEIDMKTHGADLSKGMQLLDGKKSFDYIHWRYSANGDIDRIKRQQKFLKAVYKKQRDSGKLIETVEIVCKYNNSVNTNLTYAQMLCLAKLASDIPGDGVSFFNIPGHCRTINSISYWVPDENETEKLIHEFSTL